MERRESLTHRVDATPPAPAAPSAGHASAWRWRRLSLTSLAETRVGEIFGADLRSIALFRIAIAFIVLMDLASRVPSLRAHYTDDGVLPRDLLLADLNEWRWSLLLANGTLVFQALVFLVAAAAAFLLMLGYHTRLTSVVVWVLIVSIQTRNPLLLSGADTLLRLLLFWAMFLPLGAVWSLDRRWSTAPQPPSTRLLSFGTAGLFLQIAFMYWFTVALKWGPVWVTEGSALYYATGAGQITRPLGEYLHQFPDLLRILTHTSLALEAIAPLLLFSPILTGPVRTAAAASIMAFHAGIFLLMDVGIFPWTSALCMVAFLPAWFWEVALPRARAALAPRVRWSGRASALLLQPVRSLGGVLAGGPLARAVQPATSPAQAPAIDELTGTDRSSAERPAPVATVPPPATAGARRASPLANLAAAFCLVVIFGWNMATASAFTMPAEARPVAYGLGIYQKWDMFAPRPPGATRWYVVRGELQGGQAIDLLTPIVYGDLNLVRPVSWEQPDDIVNDYYRDKYWRKYLDAIVEEGNADERRAFAAYACRTWNARYVGDGALARVEIVTMSRQTLPDDQQGPVRRTVVGEYRCT